MSGRSPRSQLAAAAAGLLVVATATLAHVAAGGTVDVYALTGIAALSGAVSTTLASRVRLTFARAIMATLLLQPVLHQMLGHPTAMPDSATGHLDHAMPMPDTGTHMASSMLATHAAVALACAAMLRWGLRWVRSMPTLGRALVVPVRTIVVPMLAPGDRTPAARDAVVAPLAILFAWDSRGPPH